MLTNRTVTKKILEVIIHETFSKFGVITSSHLLDSLKLLGFYYATNAGISINIEDLKTPDVKKEFLKNANKEIEYVSSQWQRGFVSDTERFQTIIDSWNVATESLKNRIVDYYQVFDPANNLYIMAFSGARGNMSQVRQLVGMRGLMSDQEGKIIDLPIQANFREGLSSIDYIISSYGARKGIVDTALKTADSGYLTRRLIYLTQDLIIRAKDCYTDEGVILVLSEKTDIKNIIGRKLITATTLEPHYYTFSVKNPGFLTEKKLNKLKNYAPLFLNVRSPLTCKTINSVCQYCYGWDLAQERVIALGEAVGIIAAQSIGEPGTQLTMRTFHTGGIFTSETLKQVVAPISGKLSFPKMLKKVLYRTNHGVMVLKLQQEAIFSITNWEGIYEDVFLDIGSYVYLNDGTFVKKGQVIAESSNQSSMSGMRKLKPVYTPFAGEIRFENLLVRTTVREKQKRAVKVTQDDGVLWITSGKIFSLPNEVNFSSIKKLDSNKPLATLKLVSPYDGIVRQNDFSLSILTNSKKVFSKFKDIRRNKDNTLALDLRNLIKQKGGKLVLNSRKVFKKKNQKLVLNFENIIKNIKNTSIKISLFVKDYQYVDFFTTLGNIEIFPNITSGLIYSIRKKHSKDITTFFLITENDIWKINSDQVNDFNFFANTKTIVRAGSLLNTTSRFTHSGFFLKRDGFKMIFQHASPIFLSRGTILNYKQGDFVFEKKVLATLVNYTQQTEDIIQGLPKIEELIEARSPKTKAYLSKRPGIVCNSYSNYSYEHEGTYFKTPYSYVKRKTRTIVCQNIGENITFPYYYKKTTAKKSVEKTILHVGHSYFGKSYPVVFRSRLYHATSLSPNLVYIDDPSEKKEKKSKKITEKPEKKKIFNDQYGNLILFGKVGFFGRNPRSTWTCDKKPKWHKTENKKTRLKDFLWTYRRNKVLPWFILDPATEILKNKEKGSKNKSHDQKKEGDNLIVQTIRMSFVYDTIKYQKILLKPFRPINSYILPITSKILVKPGTFIDIGEPLSEGNIDLHELLSILVKYHQRLDGTMDGTMRSLNKFQLILVNSIQAIYQSQGVNIANKHIELVVKQMTAKVLIQASGDTPFLPGELVRLSFITEICKTLISNPEVSYKIPKYEPIVLSATSSSLGKDGFLSAAGFQETKRVLTKAAIEGSSDWLRGLKECIIVGRLLPAGTSFLNYKSYLDTVYSFKDKENNFSLKKDKDKEKKK